MKLPPIRRLAVEDFPDQKQWIGRLLTPLNSILQSLSVGIQHNITFQDNIASQLITLTFTNNSSELGTANPQKFLVTLQSKPTQIIVGQAQDVSNAPQSLAGAVFPTWAYQSSSNQVVISAFSGLVSGQRYQINLLVL